MTMLAESFDHLLKIAGTQSFDRVVEQHIALIAQHPEVPEIYHALAMYCARFRRFDIAEMALKSTLELDPDHAASLFYMGRILDEQMNFEQSTQFYQKSVDHGGGRKSAFHLSLAQLSSGDLEKGSSNYVNRLDEEAVHTFGRLAEWSGEDSRKRVLIWAEQGLGDEIMFSRFFGLLKTYGCDFCIECDRRLLALYERNFPSLRFIPRGTAKDALKHFDAQLPLGGLLRLFHAQVNEPQLRSQVMEPVLCEQAAWARQKGRKYVGISWLSMNEESGPQRSIAMDSLLAAFDAERHGLVNLQYLAPAQDIEIIRKAGFELIDPVDCFSDMAGMSALIAQCDGVLTIDNTALHLAGAMGVETHALIPCLPNWRWRIRGGETPWYPRVHLLQQKQPFSWDHEIGWLRKHFST